MMYSICLLAFVLTLPVQAGKPKPELDAYSLAVASLKASGSQYGYFFVGIRKHQSYIPSYEVQPVGFMKAGEVWKVWFDKSGNLVGELVSPAPQPMPRGPHPIFVAKPC